MYDEILKRSDLKDLVFRSSREGVARFFCSHITKDELDRMGPGKSALHDELLRIAAELPVNVPSTPAVFDVSKFGQSAYGDEAAKAIYETLREKHGSEDAIHVATANSVGCEYFVTQETTGNLLRDVNGLRLPMKAINVDEMSDILQRELKRRK